MSGGKANQQFKELKDILEETNQRILGLELKTTNNHNELIERISKVEDTARKALDIGLQNANDIKKIDEQQDRMREEVSTTLKAEVKEELLLEITKLQAQMKATLIELEDLQNRTMRSKLIFKNIPGIQNESWEDTCQLLSDFITCELDLPYSIEEINFQIIRAHQSTEKDKDHSNNQRRPKPIFSQFVNWRITKEIRNRIIELNAKRRINVFASQMYSKELTLQRNGALKHSRDYLNENSDVQIKLEFPAILRYRRKGSRGKWDKLKVFKILDDNRLSRINLGPRQPSTYTRKFLQNSIYS